MTTKHDKTSALSSRETILFSLEVVEGPMDGALLSGALSRVRIGRIPGNDFELHSDRSVSGEHAVLSRRADGWQLDDLRSTNGTFVDDQNLRESGPRALPTTCDFMIGHTVVRCRPGGGESFLPAAADLKAELGRLAEIFSRPLAEGYGAAVALALAEKRSYLSDRHLFWGICALNPELPVLEAAGGAVPARFLAGALLANEYWLGEQAWIHRRLKASVLEVEGTFESDLTATPRLLSLLYAAEEAARQAGEAEISVERLLHAYLHGPANRTRELLARAGVSPETLQPALERLAVASLAKSFPEPRRAEAPHPAPTGKTVVYRATSGDPGLDARAQEVARGLYGVAALYGLAASEERLAALKQLLTQEVARIPADHRTRLLRQVQRLFPVEGGSDLDATLGALARRRQEIPPPAAAAAEAPRPADAIPWRPILERGKGAAPEGLAEAERAALDLTTEVFGFAMNLERFLVTVVHSLKSQGVSGTTTMQLPGFRTSIQRFAKDLAAGKKISHEDLCDYLGAVETWLAALTVAFSEGPDIWFKELWSKLSPAAIESRLADDKWVNPLRIDALTYWNRFKERAHGLSPELAFDQIQRRVWQRAEEQYRQLSEKRRHPS